MNTPDPSIPGLDDIGDVSLHEPRLREPCAADVVLEMSLVWGCGIEKAKRRLCAMNFENVELT